MAITLTGNDYADLLISYSDLNIISDLSGSEYNITTAETTNFDIIENEIVSNEGVVTPTYSKGFVHPSYGFVDRVVGYDAYIRAEAAQVRGTIRASIDSPILDVNNIAVSCSIDYDTYKKEGEFINSSNFSSYESVYIDLMDNQYLVNKDDDGNRTSQKLEDNQFLPVKKASAKSVALGIIEVSKNEAEYPSYTNYISRPKLISTTEDGSVVEFSFNICKYYGYNQDEIRLFGATRENYLNVINTIKFSIQAQTIEANENKFVKSSLESNIKTKEYEMESNELLQYDLQEPEDDRLSTKLANKIFKKTDINRQIISFKLLKNKKYEFQDGDNVVERYLDVGDEIYIKDELGEYVGLYYDKYGVQIRPKYEIISYEPEWEGVYVVNIEAKQIYETSGGFVFSGLDSNGNITDMEENIVAYMIGDNSSKSSNGYIGYDKEIEIPDEFLSKPVVKIGRYAFYDNDDIEKVTLSENISSIEEYAFSDCSNLYEIVFNENLVSIENNVFSKCKKLNNISLPNSLVKLGNSCFRDCEALSSISIPLSVESFGSNLFKSCISLTSIPLNIKYISDYMFAECTGLVNINDSLPTGNVNNLISIGNGAFYGCSNILSVDLSLKGYSKIGAEAFRKCSMLKTFVAGSVSNIGQYCFAECKNLENVSLSTGLVDIKDYTFYNCLKLSSILIPNGVETIGESAFNNCHELQTVSIPNSVKSIESKAFFNTHKLKNITIGTGLSKLSKDAFFVSESIGLNANIVRISPIHIETFTIDSGNPYIGSDGYCVYEKQGTYLFAYNVPEGSYSVPNGIITIPDNIFNNSQITELTIPDSVEIISKGSFSNSKNLTSVNIGSGTAVIGDFAFQGCSNLKTLNIGSGVQNIGDWIISGANQDIVVKMYATTPPALKSVTSLARFSYNGVIGAPLSIEVPASSVDLYKNAPKWNYYINFIN